MLSKIKALFRKMSVREQVLCAAVIWALIFVWFSEILGGFKALKGELSMTHETLATQREMLDMAPSIKAQFDEVWRKLIPEKTFSGEELVVKVEEIAAAQKLIIKTSNPETEPYGLLDLHTIRVKISNAAIEKLMGFDALIKQESPYIALQYVNISANAKPPLLNATFEIRAFARREGATL